MIQVSNSQTEIGAILNSEKCWDAVLKRDTENDGKFVYAVKSTGIYCRPSCPSRRPSKDQVTFFLNYADAESAGFRSCRRCHPHLEAAPEPQRELIEDLCRYIEAHLDSPLRLADLSEQVHLSPYHLQRTFKRIIGLTPKQYAETCRVEFFKSLLQSGSAVTSAIFESGYRSSSSAYNRLSSQLGMAPKTFRKGGYGIHINFAITGTLLGYALIATTSKGIIFTCFGDSEKTLQEELIKEYPQAEIVRNDEDLQMWVKLLQDYLEGKPVSLNIPLDVRATSFQIKVWQTLRSIPSGQTLSYAQIAEKIGCPKAARAVGHACATNPVSIFIPCHRAVRGNRKLAGYRWGLERKRKLLEMEGAYDITDDASPNES